MPLHKQKPVKKSGTVYTTTYQKQTEGLVAVHHSMVGKDHTELLKGVR